MAEVETLTIRPNSKPQEAFLAANEYEVLYGGAAGGGKTEGIIIDPLRYTDYRWFNAIIFRESFPELEKNIIPEATRIYQAAGATWHDSKRRFTFPSGATIEVGYLAKKTDWSNYQGAGYIGQYFDELTNIPWENYEKLAMWNRAASSDATVTPYRRSTSNPGGISHSQVKAYFVDTCPAFADGPERFSELANMTWQPMRAGRRFTWTAPNGMKLTRRYIPARVFDNEDLLRINPVYLAQLLKMDENTRRMFLEGNWDVFEGQFFWMFNRDLHVLDSDIFHPEPGWPISGTIDYGERTALELATTDYEGNTVFFGENYTERMTPSDRANAMADLLIALDLKKIPVDYDTNMDISLKYYTGEDKTPAEIFRGVFQDKMQDDAPRLTVVSKHAPDNDYRIAANEVFKEGLGWELDENGAYKRRPKVYVTDACPKLIESISGLVTDPNSKKGLDFIEKGAFDDPYDAAKMELMRTTKPRKPKPKLPSWFNNGAGPARGWRG